MRPFDHVWGGGSATCALRMRCLAGIVLLPIVLTPFLSPPPAGEGFNGDEGLSLRLWDPHPCPLPEGEGARTGGTLCTSVGQESNDTAQWGRAVYLVPPAVSEWLAYHLSRRQQDCTTRSRQAHVTMQVRQKGCTMPGPQEDAAPQ